MVEHKGVAVFAPTPLVTVTIEQSAVGDEQLHIHLGGQGVWVARMVARLGLPVTLCTAFGGEPGEVARNLLNDDAITLNDISTVAWNGGYVHDRRTGSREELAAVAPAPLLRHELDNLYSRTLAAAFRNGVCVLTGTHRHPVVPDSVYRRLAHDLHANGVVVVADLSGGQLTAALEGGVTLIKTSEEDLRRDGWIADDRDARDPDAPAPDDLVSGVFDAVLADLTAAGAEHALVSRSERPTEALIDGVRYRLECPVMEPVDHRGAGDAMTGALAAGFVEELETTEMLRMACAAGAATVVRHGYATGTLEAIESLSRAVRVHRLN